MEQTNVKQDGPLKKKKKRAKSSWSTIRKYPKLSPEMLEFWRKDRKAWMAYVRSKKTPENSTRAGIPDGMRREEAEAIRAQAKEKGAWLVSELQKEGVVSFDPNISEDEMAKQALVEAFTIAMTPGRAQEKNTAIRTVLEWTKAKPATKTDLRLNNAEAWLAEVVSDHKATDEGKS